MAAQVGCAPVLPVTTCASLGRYSGLGSLSFWGPALAGINTPLCPLLRGPVRICALPGTCGETWAYGWGERQYVLRSALGPASGPRERRRRRDRTGKWSITREIWPVIGPPVRRERVRPVDFTLVKRPAIDGDQSATDMNLAAYGLQVYDVAHHTAAMGHFGLAVNFVPSRDVNNG